MLQGWPVCPPIDVCSSTMQSSLPESHMRTLCMLCCCTKGASRCKHSRTPIQLLGQAQALLAASPAVRPCLCQQWHTQRPRCAQPAAAPSRPETWSRRLSRPPAPAHKSTTAAFRTHHAVPATMHVHSSLAHCLKPQMHIRQPKLSRRPAALFNHIFSTWTCAHLPCHGILDLLLVVCHAGQPPAKAKADADGALEPGWGLLQRLRVTCSSTCNNATHQLLSRLLSRGQRPTRKHEGN